MTYLSRNYILLLFKMIHFYLSRILFIEFKGFSGYLVIEIKGVKPLNQLEMFTYASSIFTKLQC